MEVTREGVRGLSAEVEVDAADGHVHGSEAPGGLVGFLPVHRDKVAPVAVRVDEFIRLNEEAARAHRGVVDAALERLEDFDDEADDGFRGVELAALFSFGARELAEEVFVDVAENVFRVKRFMDEGDGADDVADEAAVFVVVDALAREVLEEDILELGVFLFDFGHRIIDEPPDSPEFAAPGKVRADGEAAVRLDVFPARAFGYPEHVFFCVVVPVLELFRNKGRFCVVAEEVIVFGIGELLFQFGNADFEGVGNIFDEDEAEHDVLVACGIEARKQFIGRLPQFRLKIAQKGYFFGIHWLNSVLGKMILSYLSFYHKTRRQSARKNDEPLI